MTIDSTPQTCHRCLRSVVLASLASGRRWLHVGTWRPECEPMPRLRETPRPLASYPDDNAAIDNAA